MINKETEELISRFFRGEASEKEVIALWVLMAKDPDLAAHIEIESGLRLLYPAPPENEVHDPDHRRRFPFRWFGNLA